MANQNAVLRTKGCMCPYYSPRKPKRDNPLVGSLSITETLTNDDGETSTCTDTYTFYRNGSLKLTKKIDGKALFIERGTYSILRDKLIVRYSRANISEEAIFCIIDNKLSLRFDLWEEPIILTKQQ